MIVRRLYTTYNLLAFLEQDTELTNGLKELLKTDDGQFAGIVWYQKVKSSPGG
jgi:hypothetical protein